MSDLASWFRDHRLPDGGWNCAAEDPPEGEQPSTRSSFHSTLNALRGLLAYERITGDTSVREVRRTGEEYLLERQLLYRLSTGALVRDFATECLYPNPARYRSEERRVGNEGVSK